MLLAVGAVDLTNQPIRCNLDMPRAVMQSSMASIEQMKPVLVVALTPHDGQSRTCRSLTAPAMSPSLNHDWIM